jgi:hypothetical protein
VSKQVAVSPRHYTSAVLTPSVVSKSAVGREILSSDTDPCNKFLRFRWVCPPEQPRSLQLGLDSGRAVAGVRTLGRPLHHHLAPTAPVSGCPPAAGVPVVRPAQARQRAAAPVPGCPPAVGACGGICSGTAAGSASSGSPNSAKSGISLIKWRGLVSICLDFSSCVRGGNCPYR